MANTEGSGLLRRKAEVVAAVDLPGVPAGTTGKVTIVNGLTWIRYWVRFDNGVAMGSLGRDKVVTPDEWQRISSGEGAQGPSAGGSEDGADLGGDAADGEGVAVNGVLVPARLLDRSKAARARLGA